MQQAWSWVKRVFGGGRTDLLSMLTPEAARDQNPVVRIGLAGATAMGLGFAASVGVVAMAALFFAVAVIYFIATQVLGLKLDVDPRMIYERVQRQAASYGPN